MVAVGTPGADITGILNAIPAGRLRPARPEEGFGLVWEADLPFLQAAPFAFGIPAAPPPLPMPSHAPLDMGLPLAWPAPFGPSLGPSLDWLMAWPLPDPPAAEAPAAEAPAEPGFDAPTGPAPVPSEAGTPLAMLSWLPPDVWGAGPHPFHVAPPIAESPASEPPASGPDASAPGTVPPRSPGLPGPLFAPPELEGGIARQVSVAEGAEDVVHQPGVTDRPAEGLGWRITGGADAALLLMDPASGALRFLTAPDFEQPGDADGDNRYELVFEVQDGWGAAAAQRLVIAVTDAVWG